MKIKFLIILNFIHLLHWNIFGDLIICLKINSLFILFVVLSSFLSPQKIINSPNLNPTQKI